MGKIAYLQAARNLVLVQGQGDVAEGQLLLFGEKLDHGIEVDQHIQIAAGARVEMQLQRERLVGHDSTRGQIQVIDQ